MKDVSNETTSDEACESESDNKDMGAISQLVSTDMLHVCRCGNTICTCEGNGGCMKH